MNLRESIESINEKLLREFGSEYGSPRFRVVFSEDQFEKRWTKFTDEGFELLQPEVRLLPKYRQWVRAKYILERFVPVPDGVETDLTTKMTWEPLWVFQDKNQNYLPPFFDGCKLIIDNMYGQLTRNYYAKYKDKMSKEEYEAQIKKTQDDLFGNETDVGDHLAYGTGVTVPADIKTMLSKEENETLH